MPRPPADLVLQAAEPAEYADHEPVLVTGTEVERLTDLGHELTIRK